MSAEGVVDAVIARVEEFLLEEGAPASCDRRFIENLRTHIIPFLRNLKSLLEGKNVAIGNEITSYAYWIEDAVERQALLGVADHMPSKFTKYFRHMSSKFTKYFRHTGNKKSIENLFNADVGLEHALGGLFDRIKYDTESIPTASEQRTILSENISEMKSDPDEDATVGLEDDLRMLLDKVICDGRPISRTAIIGMPGIGKTALAMKFFKDDLVTKIFDISSWVTVSQDSDVITVVRSILEDISDRPGDELLAVEDDDLMVEFCNTLADRRCFIILDNIWSVEIWDKMQHFFPEKDNGSSIVITSRDLRVAESFAGNVYNVPLLTPEESEKLLEKKLRFRHSEMYKNASLEGTMTTIISMCHGVPSEIIRIANILEQTERELWEKVVDDLLESQTESFFNSTNLSYDYLQPCLKPCFLYLGFFCPSQPIQVEKLQLMWMAERFIVLKDTAESYLTELANKNLILVTRKEELSGELLSCQLEFIASKGCILKGKAERFVEVGSYASKIENLPCRAVRFSDTLRFSIGIHDLSNSQTAKHTRSLFFYGYDDVSHELSKWRLKIDVLNHFELARVMDFDRVNFRTTKPSVCKGKLLHLRYLSFQRCYLKEFPFEFWRFPYLETLDLRVLTEMIIPNVLWKMSNLKHLYFPWVYKCKTGEKLTLKGAEKLRVIENFNACVCDVDELLQLKNLEDLKIISDGENTALMQLLENVPHTISKPHSPIKISLVLKDFDCYSVDRRVTLMILFGCEGIQSLYLEGHIGCLPSYIHSNYIDIVLDGTFLTENPMLLLGELESLKSLVLRNDAILVERIFIAYGRFPSLQSLELTNLSRLKHWVLGSHSMLTLTVLTIERCLELVDLPMELTNLHILRHFNIGTMSPAFMEQVDQMKAIQKGSGYETTTVTVIRE